MDVDTAPDDLCGAQLVFARWIDVGAKLGMVLLTIGFAAYVSGLIQPQFPIEELPKYWGMELGDFVKATGAPRGWEWLRFVDRGDYLNFLGIGVLASIVIASYVRIVPMLLRGDRVFAAIAVLEVLVLAIAASGLLNGLGGRH